MALTGPGLTGGRAAGTPAPYGVAAFMGSFLLFWLELIAARLLLPSYGGAAYVWTACMMYFQGLLFAGYLYSSAALSRWGVTGYARRHWLLLAVSLAFFPISLSGPAVLDHPTLRLLALLTLSIGAPFFVLSTTSPVIQSWVPEGREGYVVYAASNAGALAALLGCPLLIDPLLGLAAQSRLWELGYLVYAGLHWPCRPRGSTVPGVPPPLKIGRGLSWLLLSLGPSALLLAATQLLTLDFAALPLLWALPLALYLATFILCFKREPWYPQRLSLAVLFIMLAWLVLVVVTAQFSADWPDRWGLLRRLWAVNKFAFVAAALFLACLICHRALAQSRPAASEAPRFYAWIGAGGFGGGLLMGLLMPWLGRRVAAPELDWALAGLLCLAGLWIRQAEGPSGAVGSAAQGRAPAVSAGALCAVALFLAGGFWFYAVRSVALSPGKLWTLRNFYGYYTVVEAEGSRKFYHGSTLHGLQAVDPAKQDEPLLYYHRGSPLGEIFSAHGAWLGRIGVVGLGAGAVAAYGLSGQAMDFYELDPDVAEIAHRHFTYLSRSRALVRLLIGDARLSLAREAGPSYDLLVLDAFAGGAIPVHLLTREAFALYLSRLSQRGMIAVHVSHRFLNLRPVLAALARDRGLSGAAKAVEEENASVGLFHSSWVLLVRDRALARPLLARGWEDLGSFDKGTRPWSDQHASLWSALGSAGP